MERKKGLADIVYFLVSREFSAFPLARGKRPEIKA
jgi:hypothetical protein